MKKFVLVLTIVVLVATAGFLSAAEQQKKKKEKTKTTKSVVNIYDVKPDELDDLIESNDEILVLFYNSNDVKSKPIIGKIDKLDFAEYNIPVVKISDETSALEYGLELGPIR